MSDNFVPKGIEDYFKFGAYEDIEKIVRSDIFLPVFVTGLSRSGKTVMIEQACANSSRDMIRVNFTEQTDEEDLIGGFRLENGNTVWFDGPIVVAMKLGAIALLDEIDLGSYKCLCLQPILEGSSLYIKKTRTIVHPKKGFNIFATANTKGQGDVRGKFSGAQILNEAFLDRFSITIEHNYPPKEVELKILSSYLKDPVHTRYDSQVVEALVDWAVGIRKNYEDNIASDLVSTGRLIHIIKTYRIFKDAFKAVRFGISRFDENMKDVFYGLFKKQIKLEEADFQGAGSLTTFLSRVADKMDMSEVKHKRKK